MRKTLFQELHEQNVKRTLRREAGEMGIDLAKWIVNEWNFRDSDGAPVFEKAQAILDKLEGK